MMSYAQEQNTFNKLKLWDEFLGFSTTTFDKHTGRYRAAHLVSSRTFDSGNTEITVYCLVETWFQIQLSADKVSTLKDCLTFRFSLSLAASFGWLNRNMLVLPSRITAPGPQHNRQRLKTLHTTLKTTIITDVFTVTQLKRSDWWGLWRLTLVELRRLRHLDSVHWTLSAAERHQSHFAVLVLKHAVFALQVQTVQDCRREDDTGDTWRLWAVTQNKLLHDDNDLLQIFCVRRSSEKRS